MRAEAGYSTPGYFEGGGLTEEERLRWACGVSLPLLTILHSVHHLHYCKVRWIKVRELTYSTGRAGLYMYLVCPTLLYN